MINQASLLKNCTYRKVQYLNHIRLLIFVLRWRKEEKKEEKEGGREDEEQEYSSSTKTVFPGAKLNHTIARLIGTTN